VIVELTVCPRVSILSLIAAEVLVILPTAVLIRKWCEKKSLGYLEAWGVGLKGSYIVSIKKNCFIAGVYVAWERNEVVQAIVR
jgi:hypothetical protein